MVRLKYSKNLDSLVHIDVVICNTFPWVYALLEPFKTSSIPL